MPSLRTRKSKRVSKKESLKHQTRRRKVTFTKTEHVNKTTRVKFTTKDGKNVSFSANKKVPVKRKVSFYAKRK